MTWKACIEQIGSLDQAAMEAASARQAQLTKPAGSLGRLESLSIQLAGIAAKPRPTLTNKVITVMAGDHGVTAAGVSAFPAEVTPQMVMNFLHGGAAINVLARNAGARVVVVDMGVASDLAPHPNLVDCKVAYGTANMLEQPAMTVAQAEQALTAGAALALAEVEKGMDILLLGDMGIGNTTPSAAIACAILGASPDVIVGRGTGVDNAGLARKRAAVRMALGLHRPNSADGLDLLAKVGGFEIAGLAGAILGAASKRVPIILDGFITTAAAMIAVQLAPQVRDYLIASHSSVESGHAAMLAHLGLEPLFDLGLRLGEASGAALALPIVEAAARILDEMATFAEAGVSGKTE